MYTSIFMHFPLYIHVNTLYVVFVLISNRFQASKWNVKIYASSVTSGEWEMINLRIKSRKETPNRKYKK